MAISASFKQPCPSCEALVPIKDVSLIGKKVDCPQCKYRFVVEDPVAKDKKAVAADKVKKNGTGDTSAAKKKETAVMPKAGSRTKPVEVEDKVEVVDDVEVDEDDAVEVEVDDDDAVEVEVDEAITTKPKGNGKVKAARAVPRRDVDEDEDEDEDDEIEVKKPKKKKKPAGNGKLIIGLGVAAVGLVVLAVAALAVSGVFGGKDKTQAKTPAVTSKDKGPKEKEPVDTKKDKQKDKQKDKDKEEPKVDQGPPAGVENTNFLPEESESVFHLYFSNLLDSPIGEAAFETRGAFSDPEFLKKLGFEVKHVDDVLCAESFTQQWTFMVLHTTKPVKDMRPLIQAMALKKWTGYPTKHHCYTVHRNAAWLAALMKLSLFVPAHVRNAQPLDAKPKPILLHMRDPQTMIFAHEEPMRQYLKADGRFKMNAAIAPFDPSGADVELVMFQDLERAGQQDGRPGPVQKDDKGRPGPGQVGGDGGSKAGDGGSNKGDPEKQPPPEPVGPQSYVTIKRALREMLLRVENKAEGEKLLFSSATYLEPARMKQPDEFGNKIFRTRPIWDVVNLLDERTDRLEHVAMSMVMRDKTAYVFRNNLTCRSDAEARQLQRDLYEKVGPEVVHFFKKVVSHNVDLIKDEPVKPPPVDPGQPGEPGRPIQPGEPGQPKVQPKKEEVNSSRIKVFLNEKNVDFTLDLVLTGQEAYDSMRGALQLMMRSLKAEVDAASGENWRHQLADAGKTLGEKGVSKHNVPPETFPPGAFLRPASAKRSNREPGNRISWMAGLLPYLGRDALYNQIQFDMSWKHEKNWLAARTLVPEFLDPSYPLTSRYMGYPGMPLDCAATHYVGISGVGVDAADAMAGDPAMLGKLGVFGYDRMTPFTTIVKGRGLSNTVLMIRVPHDGPAGTTPWMAGGGSTVRSVPDKNSLEPFLSTDDKGERGTYVLMCDGSVRYIKKGMSDAVFKAICTVDGPTPDGWNFDEDCPPIPKPKKVEPPPIDPKGKPISPGPGTAGGPVGGGGGKPPAKDDGGKKDGTGKKDMPAGWQQYTSKEGGFTVNMPVGAVAFEEPMKKSGFSLTIKGFKCENAASQQVFFAVYVSLPEGTLEKFNQQELFDGIRQTMFQQTEVKVTSETNTNLGGLQGREYTLVGQTPRSEVTLYVRFYLGGDRMYGLVATSPGMTQNSQEYTAFFGSFKLTGR
jgi:hypothetical protein